MAAFAARYSFMTSRIAICSFLVWLMAGVSTANAGLLPERVEKAAQERVAAGVYQTLVFAVVNGDKSGVVAFGKLDGGKLPSGDTVYEIGSITKTFTATLLADAVLSGHAALDEPVARLLPDFKIPERGGKQIALADLATQYSGLPRLPSNLIPAEPANPYADYDAAKLKAFLGAYELPRDPGASYEYSNLGFGLLGYALAQSAQTTYGALLEREIFQPLGMTMSGTKFTDAIRAHLAPGHDMMGDPAGNWDFEALAGAGAIRSTGADMLRYLEANMGVVRTSLSEAMTLAQKPRRKMDKQNRIGLAWMTRTTEEGDIVWHNGGTGGYRSFIGFAAEGRRGVVVLANTAISVDDLGFAVLSDEEPLTPTPTVITLAASALDEYTGSYKLKENFVLKIFRDNSQLFAQATNQGAIPIFPSAPNEFFAKIPGIAISFTRDAKGAVSGLILHQNGDHTATKLSASEAPQELKTVQLEPATLADYIGRYQFAPGAVLDVTLMSNQLHAQLTGQGAYPIYASAKDKFFYRIVDAQLDFERDSNGKVSAVVLHQEGHDLRAPRMP